MTDNRYNNALQDLSRVTMNASEKAAMLDRIIVSPIKHTAPVRSPWTIYSFSLWIQKNRMLTVVAALLIILISANGVAFAVERTLPGDTLYPVKVNVIEPLAGSLITSPVARAQYEASITNKRFAESEALAVQGNLDGAKQQQIASLIDEHTANFENALSQADKVSPQAADSTALDFQAGMSAHATILKTIAASTTSTTTPGITAIRTLAVVSAANANTFVRRNFRATNAVRPTSGGSAVAVKNTSSSDNHPTVAMMKTAAVPVPALPVSTAGVAPTAAPTALTMSMSATLSATSTSTGTPTMTVSAVSVVAVPPVPTSTPARTVHANASFAARAQIIQNIIDSTQKEIGSASTTSTFDKSIVENADEALYSARQSLSDSKAQSEAGDDTLTEDSLNESERSAKAASIILKSGLKVGQTKGALFSK